MTDYANMSTEELLKVYQAEKGKLGGASGKALTQGLQTAEDSDLEGLATASNINATLRGIRNQIADNALKIGPVENTVSQARNWLGMSNDNSRNFSSFRSALEKLRNDSLRLNKGVQTEGDATRAWNELVSNINDPALVKQRLTEIEQINARAAQLQKDKITTRRVERGVQPRDLSAYEITDQGTAENPYDLSKGQSRIEIPRGAYYRDPQGNTRRNDNYKAGNPIVKKAAPKGQTGAKGMTDADIMKALGL